MLLLPTHAPFTTQLRHVACFAPRMSGKKGNTAKGFGLNSFAVLSQAAEEIENTITQSAKAQSATSKERLLRDPLVWVDLEMTGACGQSVEGRVPLPQCTNIKQHAKAAWCHA